MERHHPPRAKPKKKRPDPAYAVLNRARKVQVRAARAALVAAFPKAFMAAGRRKLPLKIGIHADVLAHPRRPAGIADEFLVAAIRDYSGGHKYLQSCVAGAARIDLDGNHSGSVTRDHALWSQAIIKTLPTRIPVKRHQKLASATRTGKTFVVERGSIPDRKLRAPLQAGR